MFRKDGLLKNKLIYELAVSFLKTYDILEFVLGTNYSFWKKFNQINILGNARVFPFLSSPFLRSELVDIEINTLCYRYVNFSSIQYMA